MSHFEKPRAFGYFSPGSKGRRDDSDTANVCNDHIYIRIMKQHEPKYANFWRKLRKTDFSLAMTTISCSQFFRKGSI